MVDGYGRDPEAIKREFCLKIPIPICLYHRLNFKVPLMNALLRCMYPDKVRSQPRSALSIASAFLISVVITKILTSGKS